MRHDQGWFLELLDDRSDRERFAGCSRTQQYLVLKPMLDTFDKLLDGFWLVASEMEGCV
jgi:hypothetical protein